MLAYTLDTAPTSAELGTLYAAVRSFNVAQCGEQAPQPYAVWLRDDAGLLIGGVEGQLWGNAVHITALWVNEAQRGQGHAAELLRRCHEHGKAQGKTLAYVETLSFQARPFYEKQGYHVFGQIDAIADGVTYYFMQRRL